MMSRFGSFDFSSGLGPLVPNVSVSAVTVSWSLLSFGVGSPRFFVSV